MNDPLTPELEIIAALRMTAAPPQAWIDAAAMLPSTLGELAAIERVIARPEFRHAFALDPERTLADFGLPASPPLVTAVRERLAAH
ncbi:MAG TPA: hypothetical protein VG388_07680 [Solirubrobacteraceae bacterium]|jgi:hypothetical protein|nr:hypothetical protein [Solirubrobacteraceae bacterium]